jgi:hypothetical protein
LYNEIIASDITVLIIAVANDELLVCLCVYYVYVLQMVIGIYEQISGLESELSKAVERDQNSITTNVSELFTYCTIF